MIALRIALAATALSPLILAAQPTVPRDRRTFTGEQGLSSGGR